MGSEHFTITTTQHRTRAPPKKTSGLDSRVTHLPKTSFYFVVTRVSLDCGTLQHAARCKLIIQLKTECIHVQKMDLLKGELQ